MKMEGAPRGPSTDSRRLLANIAERLRPDHPDLSTWSTRYAEQHLDRLAMDLDLLLDRIPQEASILECGALPPLLTAALAVRGFRVCGLDLAPERFGRFIEERGLDVRYCDIEREPIPYGTASFDVVLFNELFEHLRINPIRTLSEVRRVLRVGGTLFLSTPNLRSFRGLRNLVLHNRGHASSGGVFEQYSKLETLGHMGHVREYTSREVVEFLDLSGFEVEEVRFRGGHGRGLVGWAERLFPRFRPFFVVVARRHEDPA